MDEIIKLESVSFSYGKKRAIDDISFSIQRGERIAVLGQNGAGKSTLFSLLSAIKKVDSGTLYLNGKRHDYKKRENLNLRKQLGLVFQEPDSQLFLSSVKNEIAFGPMNIGLPQEEVERRIADVTEVLKVEDLLDKGPHELSYGQKKRVAIAAILSMQPQILVLDEPFSGLDATNATVVDGAIEQFSGQGNSVVIASHDMDFVWRWAERVLVLKDGKVIFDGAPLNFFQDKSAVARAGLKLPIVLELFEYLGGELTKGTPRNIKALKVRLEERGLRGALS